MRSSGIPGETAADRSASLSALHRDCPARFLLDQLADKWTVLVISVLDEGAARFNPLRRRVDGITQKVLVQTLRRLERNGLVRRHVEVDGPLAVTYELTDLGRSLYAPMRALYDWTGEHLDIVLEAQRDFDQRHAADGNRS